MSDYTYTVTLTQRELTLIRVALLKRLNALREAGSSSYVETRALLADDGKLSLKSINAEAYAERERMLAPRPVHPAENIGSMSETPRDLKTLDELDPPDQDDNHPAYD